MFRLNTIFKIVTFAITIIANDFRDILSIFLFLATCVVDGIASWYNNKGWATFFGFVPGSLLSLPFFLSFIALFEVSVPCLVWLALLLFNKAIPIFWAFLSYLLWAFFISYNGRLFRRQDWYLRRDAQLIR